VKNIVQLNFVSSVSLVTYNYINISDGKQGMIIFFFVFNYIIKKIYISW